MARRAGREAQFRDGSIHLLAGGPEVGEPRGHIWIGRSLNPDPEGSARKPRTESREQPWTPTTLAPPLTRWPGASGPKPTNSLRGRVWRSCREVLEPLVTPTRGDPRNVDGFTGMFTTPHRPGQVIDLLISCIPDLDVTRGNPGAGRLDEFVVFATGGYVLRHRRGENGPDSSLVFVAECG